MPPSPPREEGGWFEKFVVEKLESLDSRCTRIEDKLGDVNVNLARVEEKSKQKATIISTIGVVIASVISFVTALFMRD